MTDARGAPAERVGRTGGSVRQVAAAKVSPVPLPPCPSRRMRPTPVVLAALFVATAACALPAPDLVLLNGRIFTADPARPWAEALAIRGERIIAVGTTADVGALAGPSTARRDLGGRTVIPGFNDAHVADPGGDAASIRAFVQAALGCGVTSMQWFVGERTVSEVGAALVEADTPARFRVLRMPRPGPAGGTIESRPHLPPQPSRRVDIRGMGFVFGDADGVRLTQAVGWGYGNEDLLAVEPTTDQALASYVDAVEHAGLAEVWMRKRPRVEGAGPGAVALGPRLRAQGMVVVQRRDGNRPLGSLLRGGVHLALGSGSRPDPFAVIAWATSPDRGEEGLTLDEAITAFTRGGAYAELSDRDKGHVTVGALADLAVLSTDPFSAPSDHLAAAHSVLTLVGGRTVHDVP